MKGYFAAENGSSFDSAKSCGATAKLIEGFSPHSPEAHCDAKELS